MQASVYTCNEVSGIYSSTTHGRYQDNYNDVIAYILDYTLQLLIASFLEMGLVHVLLNTHKHKSPYLGAAFSGWAWPILYLGWANYRKSNTRPSQL